MLDQQSMLVADATQISGKERAPHGFRIAIFSDGADIAGMIAAHQLGAVDGFTTNPTLMRKAGVKDYRGFAREVLAEIKDVPISFEVFADDFAEMEWQAREIASWGDNVFIKIPVMNTLGESSIPLVQKLAGDSLKINVTAVLTLDQVAQVIDVVNPEVPAICSIFAGRIADTGIDPEPVMRQAVEMCMVRPNLGVLWASPREVLNIYQAEACGCAMIAVTPDLLAKLPLRGKDLREFSRETVQMFFDDADKAGYTL